MLTDFKTVFKLKLKAVRYTKNWYNYLKFTLASGPALHKLSVETKLTISPSPMAIKPNELQDTQFLGIYS